ncbi:MAG: hypothetical protein PHR28_07205 [candidate division Zixibacteria bacterium]|nr:hypothetical protein [candidate division Zixibacteria bacterium]
MKSLSRPAKAAVIVILFMILFFPVERLWSNVSLPYGRVLAAVVEPLVNALDVSDVSYRLTIDKEDFVVTARMTVIDHGRNLGQYEQTGLRPINLVSYNLSLWGALFLASFFFLPARARLRYLIIAPIIIVMWHVCDLAIFAQNTYWMLAEELHRQFPEAVPYRFLSNWLWWWTFELNRRIIDPFLPMLLWLIFCWKPFAGYDRKREDRRVAAV